MATLFAPVTFAIAATIAIASNANASPITFDFTATVAASDASAVAVGTALTGWYTFESTTPDIQPSTFAGFHRGALREFVVKIGNFPAIGRGYNSSADTYVNVIDSAFDSYEVLGAIILANVQGLGDPTFPGDPIRLGRVDSAYIYMVDPSAAGFASDSLPLVPPSLAAFSPEPSQPFDLRIVLNVDPTGNFEERLLGARTLNATLNSLELRGSATAVPEPGSFMLLGMGAVMCAKRLRRARRN